VSIRVDEAILIGVMLKMSPQERLEERRLFLINLDAYCFS